MSNTLGAGPTGLALKQDGPWTYGALFNHIWSAGDGANVDISSTPRSSDSFTMDSSLFIASCTVESLNSFVYLLFRIFFSLIIFYFN
ncbi:MAG TPA: hypothetical protein EYH42_10495 [Sulfurovum sp.]|nr:hypothetical protein [Sulfurovum sp.]